MTKLFVRWVKVPTNPMRIFMGWNFMIALNRTGVQHGLQLVPKYSQILALLFANSLHFPRGNCSWAFYCNKGARWHCKELASELVMFGTSCLADFGKLYLLEQITLVDPVFQVPFILIGNFWGLDSWDQALDLSMATQHRNGHIRCSPFWCRTPSF